ncbi:uncharacterized protein SCHCODRAFT_02617800 [Schizophyllum commune H4-8]|nr:uncharacterized protein SCHCODRAFT_02617800 [Schizophyllum commune H4-8]KAI5894784.1 hypothetical protein SCHCODRAFT_02617800 [Schizophyllum commune H4-8]
MPTEDTPLLHDLVLQRSIPALAQANPDQANCPARDTPVFSADAQARNAALSKVSSVFTERARRLCEAGESDETLEYC